MELKIRELAKILESEFIGDKKYLDYPINFEMDSRKSQTGNVFWAIKGINFDSHQFVVDVMKKGAIMAIVNQDWVLANPNQIQAYIPVKNSEKAMLKLAKGYAHKFSATKIGITGSNGKTTTKDMINTVLSSTLNGFATSGNYNNHIGVPLTLFRLKHEHDYAIVEMGTNHPGEIQILSQATQPHIAIVTNIGPSHLEYFRSVENIFEEKMTIVKGLNKGGYLVVNADDKFLANLKSTSKYKLVTFGVNNGQVKPKDLTWDDNACAQFKIGRTQYKLNVPGIHNLYNALATIAVAQIVKIPKSKISESLGHYGGSHLRMEIKEVENYKIAADCYNANPVSTSMALQTIAQMTCSGKKIAVLGDMLELGPESAEMHAELGNHIAELGFDVLCTIGEFSKHIGQRAKDRGMSPQDIHHFNNNIALSNFVTQIVGNGDIVLVKASRGIKLDEVVSALEKQEG
tara:strand:- start:1528 stop:2904 length:1377 start_codon:yes stop_codon:yes gene_type:complete